MMDSYYDIPMPRQRLIVEIATKHREDLTPWRLTNLEIWKKALAKKTPLPEQQLFFMRGLEEFLIANGWIDL